MQLADDLGFPAGEPRQDGVALVLLSLAVEVLAAHAGAHELVAQMQAVRDVDRERDGLPALAELVPVGDDVADQLGNVHAVGELDLDVVAGYRAHAGQVGIDRGIDAGLDQVALRDQLADLRALDHGREDPAQAAPVAPAGRGGQSDQHRVGVGLDDLAPRLRGRVVAFVDDHQIGGRQRHRLRAHGAHPQRLHAGELHPLHRSRLESGLDDAVRECCGHAA